ncbi:nucleoside triphosphate pyrophosphohydrolase [Microbaculum marinum]|uniref:Nucleoside triphosphate pyrophosphohydrolase n=1 Tax=Microbaculum marinum TaxID=1764581 RepID=A0AAW9S0P7_9HYPH
MRASRDVHTLLEIMAALRTPVIGCPWDLEQDFGTIAPYTIEEAYEVADAIERGDMHDLCDELGDLLLQVVFHARLGEEQDAFDFGDVVQAISEKMIRRHPHVFGSVDATTPEAVKRNWDDIKAEEKVARAARNGTQPEPPSVLDDIPLALPALQRAVKLQKRAARIGFDWDSAEQVFDKIDEEILELRTALSGRDTEAVSDEIGDLLFTVANLARHAGVDPEAALRGTNDKFRRRFRHVEDRAAAADCALESTPLAQMEAWWNEAKATESAGPGETTPLPPTSHERSVD